MDKIATLIQGLSVDNSELLEQLNKELKKQQDILLRGANQLDDLLATLDFPKHSLGVLHILCAKAQTTAYSDPESFIHHVIRFISSCSIRQIKIDPRKFRLVCSKFMELCRDTKQPIRAILPLKQAINKINGGGEHITPQHYMFVLACIAAKCYKAALPVLDKFVFKIDPELTGVESVDTRLYFYYGGICYLAMKKYDKALQYFEATISTPAVVISSIMIEAYKKYILVALCHKGEVPSLPRYTHGSLIRVFKQLYPAYEEFQNSFMTRSVEDLCKVAENHGEQFQKDRNLGLVKQAIQALYRQNIQRLTKTYITLSLQSITEQTSLPNVSETERRVFQMIKNGEVFASINEKDGMVEFLENPEKYSNIKTLQYLDKQIQQSINLTDIVIKIDEEIGLEDKYLHKIIQAERTPTRFGEGEEDIGMSGDKPPGAMYHPYASYHC